jgi:arabinan endo-1,5-alpha-L-arabinosidase
MMNLSILKPRRFYKWLFLAALFLGIFFRPVRPQAQTGSVTPVHDPCIIKSEGYYYVFCTADRISIRRSADLNLWQYLGSVFTSLPAWGVAEVPGLSNIWAPDIFYHNGTYYLYYSLSTFGSNRSRIGLVTNTTLDRANPNYNWVDQGKVYESNPDQSNFNAIDPNVARDASGRFWLSFGSFWSGIKLVELDSTTFKPAPNSRLYSIASRPGSTAIEAPFIVYKDGYYYLFVSFDLCCQGVNSTYRIMVGRADQITGAYRDKNGTSLLSGGGTQVLTGSGRWRGPGHCAVLLEEDASWLVYHAYDAQNNGTPTLRISRLYWDQNGWPTLDESSKAEQSEGAAPSDNILYQNYPNPFNPTTTIEYDIPNSRHVRLAIYDVLGKRIKTLMNGQQPAGRYHVAWDGTDEQHLELPAGVYFCRMEARNFSKVIKLVLLR